MTRLAEVVWAMERVRKVWPSAHLKHYRTNSSWSVYAIETHYVRGITHDRDQRHSIGAGMSPFEAWMDAGRNTRELRAP